MELAAVGAGGVGEDHELGATHVGATEDHPLVLRHRGEARTAFGVAPLLGEVDQAVLAVLVEVADQEVASLGVAVEGLAALQRHFKEALQGGLADALHRHGLAVDREGLGQLIGRVGLGDGQQGQGGGEQASAEGKSR